MKRLFFVLACFVAISLFGQTARPDREPRWDRMVDWILNGQETLSYKTLSSPVFSGTGTGVLNMGSSGSPLSITTTPSVTVYTTSATTSGTIRSMLIDHDITAASYTAITEAFKVVVNSEYLTGDWTNAIVGRIDYGTAGDAAGGMAAPIVAEINMPAKTPTGGAYYNLDLEIETPENFVHHGNASYPMAWINFAIWGNSTAIGSWEDYGHLFRTDGLTDATGNLFFDNTLRVHIEGTNWYIPLSDAEGEFSTAYLIDVSNSTDALNLTTASIATEGGIACTKQLYLGDDLDMSVSGTGVYDITLKTDMADALSITDGTDMIVFTTTTGSPSIAITPATTITGLLTANGSVAVGDGDYIGVTANEIITFATAGTITVSGADFVVGETAAENVLRQIRIIGDADADGGGNITSETLTLSLTSNTTPTSATWGFTSTQSAGYTFDKAVNVTGLITSSIGLALGDGDYVGVTGNEIITFNTAGTIVTTGANFHVGAATATDEVRPTLVITGDADTDATATTEALTFTLTGNSTPTLAVWDITSTQSAGYRVDKSFAVGLATPNESTPTFSVRGDADSDAEDITDVLAIVLTANTTPTSATWGFTSTQSAGYTFDKEVTFQNNAAAATFGAVATDADVVLAFDAVTAQGSITYMEDEDRFDFDNDVDVIGDLTAATITSDGAVTATSGVNLGTSQALVGTTAMTIGNNGQTVAINSSDWDIGATGDMTGIGAISADGTVTFTGTVNLSGATISDDVTVSVPTNGGNAGAKNTIQGVPKIYMQATAVLTGAENIEYMDDDPSGEWTDSEGNGYVTFANDATYYKEGIKSLKMIFSEDAAIEDGAQYVTGQPWNWTDDEYVGMWIMSDVNLDANDIAFEINDSGAGETVMLYASAITANVWTWCRFTLPANASKDDITEIRIVQKVDKGIFNLYVDAVTKWDGASAVALTNGILQDGMLSVVFYKNADAQTHEGANQAEYGTWLIDYGATDSFVPIGDQSAYDALLLYAHE